MAEAILMAVTKSVIEKLASFTADLALTSATEEIRRSQDDGEDLKDVVYDINHLIDEVSTYALQRTANEGNLLIQLRSALAELELELDTEIRVELVIASCLAVVW
uniref:Uncharacterized protein n=1 Tax=Chenopodium quinoa TaxID=63459 RepID=A0A803MJ90_CHEQI